MAPPGSWGPPGPRLELQLQQWQLTLVLSLVLLLWARRRLAALAAAAVPREPQAPLTETATRGARRRPRLRRFLRAVEGNRKEYDELVAALDRR